MAQFQQTRDQNDSCEMGHITSLPSRRRQVRMPQSVTDYAPIRDDNSISPPIQIGQKSDGKTFWLSILTAVIAWVLFILGHFVISPKTSLPWMIGFKNQLISIGILLNLMKACFDKVSGQTLLTWEIRSGRGASTLQRFDSIFSQSLLWSRDGLRLWIYFVTGQVLSIILGVAYKQTIGNQVIQIASLDFSNTNRLYGLFPPTNQSFSNSFGNTPYLLTNSTFEFLEASASDDSFPVENITSPIPYGYNLLLLGNGLAAALDLPQQSYISAIKAKLGDGESCIITADIQGFVTQINETIKALRYNDSFWSDVVAQNRDTGFNGMTSFSQFANDTSLGLLPYLPNGDGTMSCLLGWYYNSQTFWSNYYTDVNNHEIQAFRNSTLMFTTHRANCHGQWRVTVDSLQLIRGDCPRPTNGSAIIQSMIFTNSSYYNMFSPYPMDILPILVHSLQGFGDKRVNSPWKVPSYTMAVVASYWARGAFMAKEYANDSDTNVFQDTTYPPKNETLETSVGVLHAYWWLYIVLLVYPLLATVALVLNYFFPDGEGFGLTSILAGIKVQNLSQVREARLSSREWKFVTLNLWPQDVNQQRDGEGYRLSAPR